MLDSLISCPKCSGNLDKNNVGYICNQCNQKYDIEDGIVKLFYFPEFEKDTNVTEKIKSFYEKTPFPNYDDFDNIAQLMEKSRKGVFVKLLDEQIPFNSSIIECGCGTGQLSNFLSISNRTVLGTDMCLNSLRLANEFKIKNELNTVNFIQMNLFYPAVKEKSFDVVISNGVLHHTSDPFLGFKTISTLVKPGGHILIGLYHKYGRIYTNIRQFIFNMTKDSFKFLDKRLIADEANESRKNAWFQDQYKNPHESKHTIAEVMQWFNTCGFQFIKSIPKDGIYESFSEDERLFESDESVGSFERYIKELSMIFTNSKDSGFFIMIGKKI
ncbi:MAG: methyltransferase domain-containing protein [Nitrospirae bacterium]|nr:methyltransferase domain-containing protein [Nitrospirota bacterium]